MKHQIILYQQLQSDSWKGESSAVPWAKCTAFSTACSTLFIVLVFFRKFTFLIAVSVSPRPCMFCTTSIHPKDAQLGTQIGFWIALYDSMLLFSTSDGTENALYCPCFHIEDINNKNITTKKIHTHKKASNIKTNRKVFQAQKRRKTKLFMFKYYFKTITSQIKQSEGIIKYVLLVTKSKNTLKSDSVILK